MKNLLIDILPPSPKHQQQQRRRRGGRHRRRRQQQHNTTNNRTTTTTTAAAAAAATATATAATTARKCHHRTTEPQTPHSKTHATSTARAWTIRNDERPELLSHKLPARRFFSRYISSCSGYQSWNFLRDFFKAWNFQTHHMLRLPRRMTVQDHQIHRLPWRVTVLGQQIMLCLPQKVTTTFISSLVLYTVAYYCYSYEYNNYSTAFIATIATTSITAYYTVTT